MPHDKFIEQISLWLDHELSPAEETELQTHLAGCPAFQYSYRAMQHLDEMFHQAATALISPPPGFRGRFETRLAHYHPHRPWHLWLGLSVLLLGAVFFATGTLSAGIALVGAGSSMLDISLVYYGLGLLGSAVSEVRLAATLAELAVRVSLMVMRQPVFWAYLLAAIGLTGLWFHLIRSVYRKAAVSIQIML